MSNVTKKHKDFYGTGPEAVGQKQVSLSKFGPEWATAFGVVQMTVSEEQFGDADSVFYGPASAAEAGGGVLFQSIKGLRQRWASNSTIINRLNATGLPNDAWIPTPKDGYAKTGFTFCKTAMNDGEVCFLNIDTEQTDDVASLQFTWYQPDDPMKIVSYTRVQGGDNMDLRYNRP